MRDIALQHQLRIARDTLRMSDTMARIMGGMGRAEARALLLDRGTARGAANQGVSMDTLYRIHTEAVNLPGIRATVAAAFPGFTLIEATGYWAGIAERSLIIEIIGTRDDARGVRDTARRIRDLNAQQAVLVTTTAIEGELI